MPRKPPPKGYLRSKDVQEILNVSGAMIKNYVSQGKITYYLPKDASQGYYLERDVRKLANELTAYLNIGEDKKHVKLALATEKDIPSCVKITRALFADGDEEAPVTPSERITRWIKKNPQVVYVLRESKEDSTKAYKVVGYIYGLPFRDDNTIIKDILQAELLGEVNITEKDIESYEPGEDLRIYIAAVAIDPNLKPDERKFYGSILIGGYIDEIIDLGKKGVSIKEIIASGATRQGIRLLQAFGFSEIRSLLPGSRLFILKIEESGAPIAEQYRKVYAEWQATVTTTTEEINQNML